MKGSYSSKLSDILTIILIVSILFPYMIIAVYTPTTVATRRWNLIGQSPKGNRRSAAAIQDPNNPNIFRIFGGLNNTGTAVLTNEMWDLDLDFLRYIYHRNL